MPVDFDLLEQHCSGVLAQLDGDAAHDLEHVRRVVHNARTLAATEAARLEVVLPAAWLHDCVIVPKDSPRRAQASRLAGEQAVTWLRTWGWPEKYLPEIAHAIEAHSFSAGVTARTIEAKVVQDADRLEALGAVGLARCLMLSGAMNRPLYAPADPFCKMRKPDDGVAAVDHFFAKLFTLEGTMQTKGGRRAARQRTDFLRGYLAHCNGRSDSRVCNVLRYKPALGGRDEWGGSSIDLPGVEGRKRFALGRRGGLLRAVADMRPENQAERSRRLPPSWIGRLGVVLVGWGIAITIMAVLGAAGRGEPPGNRPIKVPENDHVSSDSCRSCHPGNYASWHASFHRTMTQVATPDSMAVGMDGLELSYDGMDYRVERQGKAFAVRRRAHGMAAAWGEPQEIVLLTGSHTLQIYWLETGEGRTLVQFPFAYIVAEKKWAPVQQTFLLPPDAGQFYAKGEWNGACMDCHVTQGRSRFVKDSTFDSQVGEFGISCEACHRGGREHIARNRNPVRRFELHLSGGRDTTIANPARMDGPTASLVCGQCHSIWAFNNMADKIVWNRAGGNFQPGEADLGLRWVVQPDGTDHPVQRQLLQETNKYFFGDRFWGDGMVRVTGREMNGTMASPCYKGGHFSCLSCHEMHPDKSGKTAWAAWADDQLKSGAESDRSCLQCHAGLKVNLTAHTHHAAGSTGSACLNCHMPHTTYGLLRAIRSHQVSSPTVRESTEHGRPNACNLCHLDQPLAWTAGKLTEWYGQKTPPLTPDDRELSAGGQWLLKGDAAQRALVAWSMGWAPAQKASGRDWLYPFLIFTLNDPYAAVRFVSWKSLQTLPGFDGFAFDYTLDDAQQKEALAGAYQKWWRELREPGDHYRPQTLLDPAGRFRQDVFERLLAERNNRKVFLAE